MGTRCETQGGLNGIGRGGEKKRRGKKKYEMKGMKAPKQRDE